MPLRQEGASRYNVSRDLLTHYVGMHSFKKYSVHLGSGPGDGVVSVTAVFLLSRCLQSGREVEGWPSSVVQWTRVACTMGVHDGALL